MISYQELKIRLASSAFRSRFKLDTAGRRYALEKGPEQICFQAGEMLRTRLGHSAMSLRLRICDSSTFLPNSMRVN